MSQVIITESYLEDIADAIRERNGSEDTYTPAQMSGAIGNIPNTYTTSDEGKVVSSGELVAQSSINITLNGTYDTTENNEVIVNVSGSGSSTLISKTVTQNGTYNASDDSADGYSQVIVNVSGGGGGSYPIFDAIFTGELCEFEIRTYSVNGSYLQTNSQYIKSFLRNYARDRYGSTKGTSSSYGTIAQEVPVTLSDFQGSTSAFAQNFPVLSSAEYYGNIYGNTQLISDVGAVLLGDFSQGGNATGNTLSDSINNYSGVILQGIYNKTRGSSYNTSMIYVSPELNAAYWTGMKDRNASYDCNVTFTDNQTVSLSGNKQVIIYGVP